MSFDPNSCLVRCRSLGIGALFLIGVALNLHAAGTDQQFMSEETSSVGVVKPAKSIISPQGLHISRRNPLPNLAAALGYLGEISTGWIPKIGEVSPKKAKSQIVLAQVQTRPVPGSQVPPGGGRALPPGIINRPPPGFFYNPPLKLSRTYSEWERASQLHNEVLGSNWDSQTKKDLELPWPWLKMRQAELVSGAKEVDAQWGRIRPGIESAINSYITKYWELDGTLRTLKSDIAHYREYCSRTVAPEDLAWAQRECENMRDGLARRESDLIAANQANLDSFKTGVVDPMNTHNVKVVAFETKRDHWLSTVREFNANVGAALSRPQTNEILDAARDEARRTGRDVCTILAGWRKQAKASGDTKRLMKIKQAEKFAGCRRSSGGGQ